MAAFPFRVVSMATTSIRVMMVMTVFMVMTCTGVIGWERH